MLDLDQSEELYFSFKEGVDHRNILIVLTDGYIYHEDKKIMEGNQSSYLVPQLVNRLKLNNKNWKETIENKENGFISTGMDLSNLEVLVLGINPSKNNPRSEEHTSELQSRENLVCRLLLEKKKYRDKKL